MFPYVTLLSRQIPLYGLMLLLGGIAGFAVALCRARKAGLRSDCAAVIGICALTVGLIGGFVLYRLTGGSGFGLVFYGGLLGGLLGAWLGARLLKTRLSRYVAPMLPALPLAHAFGRIGCFLGGCCYGVEMADGCRFPVQLLEAALLLAIFAAVLIAARKTRRAEKIAGLYFLLYGLCRFGDEFLRGDKIRGFVGPLSVAQWISLGLIMTGSALLVRKLPKS